MAGEDQERFEDYLELERYIEELQAGHIAHPPANLTPERARVYQMAALFRSVSPEAAEPTSEFIASLHARLLAEKDEIVAVDQDTVPRLPSITPPDQSSPLQKEQAEQPPITNRPVKKNQRARSFSRRSLLGGGAVAAASLVVGTGIGAAFEQSKAVSPAATAMTATAIPYSSPAAGIPIVPSGVAVPHFVANLAEIGDKVIRFTTDTLIGYVLLSDGDDGGAAKGEVVAMSASCTHMGCIVQWQDTDRSFHCPCHGGIFTEYGKPAKASPILYLASLPRLETRVKDGKVYVMVPRGTATGTSV
jgi:Rieske Fe-S protein